jgi:hypothetical protein
MMMKKIIVLLIVLAILLAGIGYVFCANNFAMITVITKNQEKSIEIINNAIEKSSERENYEVTLLMEGTESNSTLKVKKVGNSFEFNAYLKVDNQESTYYYKEGVLYEQHGEAKTKETLTFSEAMNSIYDNETMLLTKEDIPLELKDIDVKLAFSFNPLYIGQNYITTSTDNNQTKTIFSLKVDTLGTIRQIIFTYINAQDSMTFEKHFNYGNVNLQFPNDLDTYIEQQI